MGEHTALDSRERNLRVLLVDDQQTQIAFTKALLSGESLEVLAASSGGEALRIAHDKHPDVILLDKCMPEMDGMETMRCLQADQVTADIPIIMVTTQCDLDSMEGAYTHGCADYVIKPPHRVELLAKIHSVTGR